MRRVNFYNKCCCSLNMERCRKIVAAVGGMHVRNIAMRDYQKSVTTGRQSVRQTDVGQSDAYVSLCFADDTKTWWLRFI